MWILEIWRATSGSRQGSGAEKANECISFELQNLVANFGPAAGQKCVGSYPTDFKKIEQLFCFATLSAERKLHAVAYNGVERIVVYQIAMTAFVDTIDEQVHNHFETSKAWMPL